MRAARLLLAALLLVLGTSCSGPRKEKLLRILFDEPPARGPEAAEGPHPVEEPEEEAVPASPGPSASPVFLHSPYEERECEACHALEKSISFRPGVTVATGLAESYGSRLRLPKDRICFECHDDMTAEALAEEGDVLHSPAEEGECLECHDPHRARFASLLREGDPFEKLCFQCHDPEDVLETPAHEGLSVEERKCVICHDPHVADRDYLLKPRAGRGKRS